MRLEPPVVMSGIWKAMEDCTIGQYKLQKDDQFVMGITAIHHNKQYWEDPDKFIPERFDSESKYYLTPDGKKRPPFTYNPYLEGKRICAGRKMAETISTFLILSVLG